MTNLAKLARREREIMDIVFARKRVTVNELCGELSGEPTPMAVRRMLSILMDKGHLKREKQGREFVYLPKQSKRRAGRKVLSQVIATFFDGSIGAALATHLEKPGSRISDEDVERLSNLIDELKQQRGES